jgi:hypothetical protein
MTTATLEEARSKRAEREADDDAAVLGHPYEEEPITGEDPNVVIGNQLSLTVKGAKPTTSTLTIKGLSKKVGTTEQWQKGEVKRFVATIRCDHVGFTDLARGGKGTQRSHRFVIEDFDLESID